MAPVPVGFDAWFARATQIDPAQRFQSASQLSTALTALVAASQHQGQLSGASPALDPTLLRSELAAVLRAPSESPSRPSSLGNNAVPTVATLSTTSMSSMLPTPGAGERALRPRARARRAWIAAGVAVTAVASAASLRTWPSSSASASSDHSPSTLGSHRSDPVPLQPRLENLPTPSTLAIQVPTGNAPAEPGATVVVTERAAAAGVANSTSGVPAKGSNTETAATTRSAKSAILPPARRKRTLAGTADRDRTGRARSPREHLDAYDWQ
jgi:serine/threonine-protein kinase